MPYDRKYGKVTLERQRNIADDEPVVVFRGKDQELPRLLLDYRERCRAAGSPKNHLDGITDALVGILAWQRDNGMQVPQSKGYDPR